MKIRQCVFGHFYDSSQYDKCPYCDRKMLSSSPGRVTFPDSMSSDSSKVLHDSEALPFSEMKSEGKMKNE